MHVLRNRGVNLRIANRYISCAHLIYCPIIVHDRTIKCNMYVIIIIIHVFLIRKKIQLDDDKKNVIMWDLKNNRNTRSTRNKG